MKGKNEEKIHGDQIKKETQTVEEKDAENCSIAKLTNDPLTHIFKFLSVREKGVAARVCKKWRELSSQNILWEPECVKENIPFKKDAELPPNYFKNLFASSDNRTTLYIPIMVYQEPDATVKRLKLYQNMVLYTDRQRALGKLYDYCLMGSNDYYVLYTIKMNENDLIKMEDCFDTRVYGTVDMPAYYLGDGRDYPSVSVVSVFSESALIRKPVDSAVAEPDKNKKPCIIS